MSKEESQAPSSAIMGMHDKCKQVIMFHNNLIKFLKTLKRTLPECSGLITNTVTYYKSVSRSEFIKETNELMEPHIKYISENDSGIFSDDYALGPRLLLPKLDFRKVWEVIEQDEDFQEDSELREATEISIFKHLQALYVSTNVALQQIGVFDRNMEKQKQHLMNMLDNLRVDDEVKKRIEEMKTEEAEANKNGDGMGMEKLASLLGEDNFVFQIAKDIADELDLGNDDVSDPVSAITSLFADGGRKIQELIVTVGDKLEEKIESGEVDKERLIADAKKVKQKLDGVVGKIPGLDEMMKSNGLVEQFQASYDMLSPEEQEEHNDIPDLLQKPLTDWTDEEKARLDEFAKVAFKEVPEESLDDDMPPKPKTKTKSKSSKSKKTKSKAKVAPVPRSKGTPRSKVKVNVNRKKPNSNSNSNHDAEE